MSVFIIAEAGVNHNGSLDLAKKLIDVASDAGADAVKFQTFAAEQLVTRAAAMAEYQQKNTGTSESQFEMLKRLEISQSAHEELISHAHLKGIEFMSTPFDSSCLNLLVDEFNLKRTKVSSGDINNAPFLLDIARKSDQVILSTGMSTLADVERALGVLAYGFLNPEGQPEERSFELALASSQGREMLGKRVVLLHCTSEYPAPFNEVNLRAMDTLESAFGLSVGYSDHTPGIHVALAAVARGASVIEKHFTLDRNLPGPDHRASLEPAELNTLVLEIRDIEASLGNGFKQPTQSEWKNRLIARKSLVAAKPIKAGEPMVLACKRPGHGVSPFDFWRLSGRPAQRDYSEDELLDE